MSKKIKIYLIVFLGLLATAALLHLTTFKGTFSKRSTGFAIGDVNNISAISIRHKGIEIHLEKIRQEWYINNEFPADKKQMFNFLRAMHNLRIKSPVALSEQQKIMDLLLNEGAEVTIKKRWKSRKFRVYYPEGGPTYMVLGKSKSPFLVEVPGLIGEAGELFRTDEGFWRENIVFAYQPEQISSVQVDYPSGMGEGFRIVADADRRFKVYDGNRPEPLKYDTDSLAFTYFTFFSHIPFTSLLTSSEPCLLDSLKSEIPFASVSLTTMEGNIASISLFLKKSETSNGEFDPNVLYGLINNNNDLVLTTFVNVDLLLKEALWFKQKPL